MESEMTPKEESIMEKIMNAITADEWNYLNAEIKKHAQKKLIDNMIARLSTVSREDVLFPFAGQEFRDKIIEMLNIVKGEIGK